MLRSRGCPTLVKRYAPKQALNRLYWRLFAINATPSKERGIRRSFRLDAPDSPISIPLRHFISAAVHLCFARDIRLRIYQALAAPRLTDSSRILSKEPVVPAPEGPNRPAKISAPH